MGTTDPPQAAQIQLISECWISPFPGWDLVGLGLAIRDLSLDLTLLKGFGFRISGSVASVTPFPRGVGIGICEGFLRLALDWHSRFGFGGLGIGNGIIRFFGGVS